MVSDSELSNLLGKHIGLYPFTDSNVEGASIFLTASRFAWTKNTQNQLVSIVDDNNIITIQPKTTGIILTSEAISLDGWVAGICISRVSHTVKELILPSTPIKPGWTGRLVIASYNTSNHPISISVGERISVVMFSKLKNQALFQDTRTTRTDILSYIGGQPPQEQIDSLKETLNQREFINPKYLIEAMERSEEYLTFKRRKKKKDPLLIAFIICSVLFCASTVWFLIQQKQGAHTEYIIALLTVLFSAALNLAFKKWIE